MVERTNGGSSAEPTLTREQRETIYKVSSPEAVALVRVVHAQSKTVEEEDGGIIDSDLALPPFDQPTSRAITRIDSPITRERAVRIISQLQSLGKTVEELPQSEDQDFQMQLDFLEAKLRAFVTFYGVNFTNVEMSHSNYIKELMGIEPVLIGEGVLEDQLTTVRDTFNLLGQDSYDRASIEEFRSSQLIGLGEIRPLMETNGRNLLAELSRVIGRDFTPNFVIEHVAEDKYWINWADGNRERFRLRVNTHTRHAGRLTRSKIESMVSHEIVAHFGQMFGWMNNPSLIPILGVTTVFDPEQVTAEGIAQTLHLFVDGISEKLSAGAKFELEYEGLRQMAYNNIHTRLSHGEQMSQEEAGEYVRRYCPAETDEEISKQIMDRTADPVFRAYLYAYGIGFAMHKWMVQSLNYDGRRRLLRLIFRQPVTPQQELDYVNNMLSAENRSRYGRANIQTWEQFLAA